ncbi:metallophosphoesterase family protein [Methylobacterium sp. J-067]|uniref:metallophosphoesterase family protein n=1 Tax=Methylobacterium sp. J-067 TaxID=2836648 RepID=UPI001FBB670E|nr:metallophosphoesterase [Methylobacterium sp. J-067]MCJ2025655.1 metallophosphoesterase [Methylobacterium sp. J-067]
MTTLPSHGSSRPFVFLHVGDQHLTVRDAPHHRDLIAILDQIASFGRDAFDFVYLPGDIAENGAAGEYTLIEQALRGQPSLPILLIPGDHDRQYGAMEDFARFHEAVMAGRHPSVANDLLQPPAGPGVDPQRASIRQYYYAADYGDVRCLFVDMISAGFGQKGKGLDFRIGPTQMDWLSEEVVRARSEGKTCAVFMHAYPDDLEKKEAAEVAGLFWSQGVRLVEMGHTHYNELAHDGRTTYAAARSVGQNEDGSVGYAVGAIDAGEVSWRFRPLDRVGPFVLITSPADRRLATHGLRGDEAGRITVRAVVLSDEAPSLCRCRVDDGAWQRMERIADGPAYMASVAWTYGARRLTVEAIDPRWPGYGPDYIDRDVIEPASSVFVGPMRPDRPGSDACSLGAWLEKGVRGDQLGPNRAGREW